MIQVRNTKKKQLLYYLQMMGVAALFNVACAVVVTYFLHLGGDFFVNVVHTMYVGLLAHALIHWGGVLIWGYEKAPVLYLLALLGIAAPISFIVGRTLAAKTLGMPLQHPLYFTSQANTTTLLAFTVLASAFGTWLLWKNCRTAEIKAQIAAEKAHYAAVEKHAMQAQLQLLQAQIEPHFLFNTLANVQSYIDYDARRAKLMLESFTDYLRASISKLRNCDTTLGAELEMAQSYLSLLQIRMGDRLTYTIVVDELARAAVLPPLLLQPLVENAIHHGLEPKLEGGHLLISAKVCAGQLVILVDDDGLGLYAPKRPNKKSNGVATENIRLRLQARYSNSATLILQALPTGTRVSLCLPYETEV